MRKEANKYFELCQALQGINSESLLLRKKKNIEETNDRIKGVEVKRLMKHCCNSFLRSQFNALQFHGKMPLLNIGIRFSTVNPDRIAVYLS